MVEAFYSLEKFMMAKLEFTTDSYLEGFVDCKAKDQSLFSDIDISPVDTDKGMDMEEGARLGGAEDVLAEDVGATSQPRPVIMLVEPDVLAKKPDIPTNA